MLGTEFESSDKAVQTSLEFQSEDSRANAKELEQLREEKTILEGKIRGYLTLSDICHEYKVEAAKLQLEYNQLLEKSQSLSVEPSLNTKPPYSESPFPDDPGTAKVNEIDQRTDLEKMDRISEPMNFSIGEATPRKSLPGQSGILGSMASLTTSQNHRKDKQSPAVWRKESVAMQESLINEPELSKPMVSLGLNVQVASEQAVGSFVHVMPRSAHATTSDDDLMYFSQNFQHSKLATTHTGQAQLSEPGIESLATLPSLNLEDPDMLKVITDVKRLVTLNGELKEQNAKLSQTNSVLIEENRKLKSQVHTQTQEIIRHITTREKLESELTELRRSNPPKSLSPHNAGWVHVETKSATSQIGEAGKETATNQQTGESMGIQTLQDQNKQLLDANQRWAADWSQLQSHFQSKVADLQGQRDQLTSEVTDLQIQAEQRQLDTEKTLAASRKALAEAETAKEEALHQLTSATGRADTLEQRLVNVESDLTKAQRDNQALEAELSVLKTRPGSLQASSRPSRAPAGKSADELRTENEVLRQQLVLFHEDFDRERQDRAKAQSGKDDLQKNYEQQKRRIRMLERQVVAAERQAKFSEENLDKALTQNGQLIKEMADLKNQLTDLREKEASARQYMAPYAMQQPPVVQSAGLHQPYGYPGHLLPQQQFLRQPPRPPQPQQHIVPAMPGNQQAHMQQYAVPLNYGNPAASPTAVGMPVGQYYQANNAGTQNEQLPGAWPCNSCTYLNYPGRTVCEMCGYVQNHSDRIASAANASETLRPRGEELMYMQNRLIPVTQGGNVAIPPVGNVAFPRTGNVMLQPNGNQPVQHPNATVNADGP